MSCCSCGSGCSPGCGCLYQVVLPENPVEGYQSLNINTLGIGVYDSTEGTTFQFRGVYSLSPVFLVTLDAANAAIAIDIDPDALILEVPQATTTQRGVGETATDAESVAKTSTTVFVTPSNFAAMGATTLFAGFVELATSAETQAGVSTTLAVTPAGLASVTAGFQGTETWPDAVARAGADPDFEGQVGVQLDSDIIYVSTGAAVGDFNMPAFMLGNASNQLPSNTDVDLNSNILLFVGPGTMEFASATFIFQGGLATFDNGDIAFGSTASLDVDFGAQARVQAAGVDLPANSVFITTGTAGELSSALISTFVSTANVQTGWVVTNPVSNRALDVSAATLGQVREVLGSLIDDLKAVLLPAT